MKRNLLTALFTLCLMLLLLPTSAEAMRTYALPEAHQKDTVRWSKLYDVETEKLISFQYQIPKNGAAVLIFYKTSCGNSQAAFTALNHQDWVHDDRINFYAVESTSHTIADIRAFQKEYAPNITDAVTWLDSTNSNTAFDYLGAAGSDSDMLTFPLMVVCTEEQGVKTIRAADIAVTDVRYLGNTLEQLLKTDLGVEKTVPLTISVVENHDLANETLECLNQYRREQGLTALHPNKKLTELAMLRAAELQIYPQSYARPDSTYNYDVVWDHLPAITTGNAIVAPYHTDLEAFLNAIQNNSFFNGLILDEDFTQIGVGCIMAGNSYHWCVTLTDDNGHTEPPCQTGRISNTYTIPTYLDNLPYCGVSPDALTLHLQGTASVQLFANIYDANTPLFPAACDKEIKDSNGSTIATAALQADGTILIAGKSLGTGELHIYGWENRKDPYIVKVTVSEDPLYEPHSLHTTVKGGGQIISSHKTAIYDTYIRLTVEPDEGWWLAALYLTDAYGNPISLYSSIEESFFFMPMSDVYITGEFLTDSVPKTKYSVGYGSKGNGSLSFLTGYSAYAGTTVSVLPIPEDGHVLNSLTVTDASDNPVEVTENTDGSYSFQMPPSNVTIRTVFSPADGYRVIVTDSYCCTVTPSADRADPGETITVTIIPDEGYELRDYYINLWNDDSTLTDKNTLTFTMPDFDVELSVYCKPSPITAGTLGDNTRWSYKDGTLTISGEGSMGENENFSALPWYDYLSDIHTVVIEEGVTDIFNMAFAYTDNLTAVTIPASVEYIDSWAFLNAEALTDINFSGPAPSRGMEGSAFANVSAFVNVPANDRSWTKEVTLDYGGNLMWSHSWSEEVTEPTCTEEGYTTYTCTCGDTQQDNFTAPLGHDYTDGLCTRCGEADPDHKEPITNPFTDVADTDWFYNPVLWAVENKVTGGMTETTFGPNVNCTRAQVVTFLYAAAGKPEITGDSEPFDDVSEADWFYKPVLWAVEKGITGGISPTLFGPNQECTRAQVVTFLYAAAGKPEIGERSDFADVADTDWYAKPVIWAKAKDITGGISATEFGPNNICTRAQVVTFLYKASQIQ